MPGSAFRYQFDDSTDMAEVEAAMVLAIMATEAVHGETKVRLLADHAMDLVKRSCVIDGGTDVGWDLSKLFTQFVTREFGPDSFRVERIDVSDPVHKATRS